MLSINWSASVHLSLYFQQPIDLNKDSMFFADDVFYLERKVQFRLVSGISLVVLRYNEDLFWDSISTEENIIGL